MSVGIFSAAACAILGKLDKRLRQYEAGQPDTFASEIFSQYFSNGTMTDYIETSSGLSEEKKYIVRMNRIPIAFFSLTETTQEANDRKKWNLKTISMIIPANIETADVNRMNEEQRQSALGALKARAEYFINAKGADKSIAQYYDAGSSAYLELAEMGKELWMNDDDGHSFRNDYLYDYVPYSEHLFSVRGESIMNVYCTNDGSYKDYAIGITMFFYWKDGKWVCFETSNGGAVMNKNSCSGKQHAT